MLLHVLVMHVAREVRNKNNLLTLSMSEKATIRPKDLPETLLLPVPTSRTAAWTFLDRRAWKNGSADSSAGGSLGSAR